MYAIIDEQTKPEAHGETGSFLAALVSACEAFAAHPPEPDDAAIPSPDAARSPPR